MGWPVKLITGVNSVWAPGGHPVECISQLQEVPWILICNDFLRAGYDPRLPNRAIFVEARFGETCSGGIGTMTATVPSTPGLGEDVATHRAGLQRQPRDLGGDWACPWSAPTACPPARGAWPRPLSLQDGTKWAPRGTLPKAFLSQNAPVPRKGMLCVARMDGLSTHPSPNLTFSLGERKVAGEEAKRPGRCQHSNGKGLPLEWARWQRNELQKCCDKWDSEIYFKMKCLWKWPGTSRKRALRVERDAGLWAGMTWNTRERCGSRGKARGPGGQSLGGGWEGDTGCQSGGWLLIPLPR